METIAKGDFRQTDPQPQFVHGKAHFQPVADTSNFLATCFSNFYPGNSEEVFIYIQI